MQELWTQLSARPELLSALVGAIVGGLLTALASALVTWRQIVSQRKERERAERRGAYLAYIEWLTKTRAGRWLSEEDRAVTQWDAGAVEIAAAIFGSDLVREGLGLVSGCVLASGVAVRPE